MWQALAGLSTRDWLVVAAGLVVVALLQVWPAGRGGLADDPAASTLPRMSAKSRAAYDDWQRQSGHFAAFALSGDGSAWGWTNAFNTLAAAEANAMAHCSDRRAGCRIIERILPAGDRLEVAGAAHVDAMLAALRDKQPYAALAISDNGAASWVAGRASQAQADADALGNCEILRLKSQASYLPDWPCRVIARLDLAVGAN